MIKRLPDGSINLGLRPRGLYELVDTLGHVSFHQIDPGGEDLEVTWIEKAKAKYTLSGLRRRRVFIFRDARLRKQSRGRLKIDPETGLLIEPIKKPKKTTTRKDSHGLTTKRGPRKIDPLVVERIRLLELSGQVAIANILRGQIGLKPGQALPG